MSDDASAFDLAAASAGAIQSMTTDAPAPAAPDAAPVAAATTPTETAPVPSAEPVAAAAPADAPPAADPQPLSISITHRGRPVTLTDPEEIRAHIQKGYDYTVKTQELSETKRQLEAREQAWLQREQQIVEFLADDKRVEAFLQQRRGQAPQPAQPQTAVPSQSANADDLLTVGQVQQILEAERQRMAAAVRAELSQVQQSVQQQMPQVAELVQQRQVWAQDVENHLAGLQTKYPELRAVEDFGPTMKAKMRDYLQANPGQVQDLDTAKALIHDWAKSQATQLKALADTAVKHAMARAAKAQPSILPPGGRPTTQTGVDTSHMKIGDPNLTRLVAEFISR